MRLITTIISMIISLGLTAQVRLPARIEAENTYYYKGLIDSNATSKYLKVRTNDWIGYYVDVPATGNYILKVQAFNPGAVSYNQVKAASGTTIAAFTLSQNTAWTPLSIVVPLAAGKQVIWIIPTSGTYFLDWIEWSLQPTQYVTRQEYDVLKTSVESFKASIDSMKSYLQKNVVTFDTVFSWKPDSSAPGGKVLTIPRLIKTP